MSKTIPPPEQEQALKRALDQIHTTLDQMNADVPRLVEKQTATKKAAVDAHLALARSARSISSGNIKAVRPPSHPSKAANPLDPDVTPVAPQDPPSPASASLTDKFKALK